MSGPYAAAKAYVQAVVEPVGSANTCSSGIGTQTWLIPANADNTVAPTIEPTNWSVLGAFTDPTDGASCAGWCGPATQWPPTRPISRHRTTLLVGPPTGPAPYGASARVDGTMLILAPTAIPAAPAPIAVSREP